MKANKLNHTILVTGRNCVHVNSDRSTCTSLALKGAPHGWLCAYHEAIVTKRPLFVVIGGDKRPNV